MSAKQILPGTRITSRTLDMRHGSEGPQHDPYSFTEFTMCINGWSFTLHLGLGCWLKINGREIDDNPTLSAFPHDERGAELVRLWEVATGLTLDKFERIYNERFYFDDPMGHPSQYI